MPSAYEQALIDSGGNAAPISIYDQALLDSKAPTVSAPKQNTMADSLAEVLKENPIGATYAAFGAPLSDVYQGVKQWFGKGDQQSIANNRQIENAHPVASTIGNVATYAPLALVPGANTLAGGAALGAVTGAAQPTLGDESRVKNVVMGGALGAAVPAISNAVRLGKSLAEPLYNSGRENILGRTLSDVAGKDEANVISKLKNANELVPGSFPTSAEVAENGGISALQRASTQAFPTPYTTRALQQQSARMNALRSIGQDQPALSAAETARGAATAPLYQAANKASIPITPELQGIIDKLPQGVMGRAADLARQEKTPFIIGTSEPEKQIASGVLDASGNHIMTTIPAKQADISGSALGYINKALQDVISGAGDTQIGANAKRLATQTRQDLLAHMDANIPEFAQARSQYQKLSEPINQMQVGQSLLDNVTPALSDYGALGKETAAKYAQALRNSLQTVKSATGFEQPIENLMSHDQMTTLNNVGRDLARKSNAQELGRGVGSNTFQNLAMENIANQSGYPRITGAAIGGINGLVGHLPFGLSLLSPKNVYAGSENTMQQMLSNLMLQPQEAGRVMENAAKPTSAMIKALRTGAQGLSLSAAPQVSRLQ